MVRNELDREQYNCTNLLGGKGHYSVEDGPERKPQKEAMN